MAYSLNKNVQLEFIKKPTQLQILLDEIRFQQQKEDALSSDIGNFISRGTTYWTDVFVRHFLFQTDRSIDADDLLFFIRKRHLRGNVTKFQTDVEVFRKDSKKLPIGDPEIEWQETVFLNLLIHQLEYTLTLAICTRTSPKDLQVLKRHSQKVYASPSRRRMDSKGDVEEITYPFLSFMVDNFDEVYSEMTVRDGEMVCVELMASDRDHGFKAVLFLGSIRYDALKRVYDSRSSMGSKMAQKMTFGLFSGSHHHRVEYVRLRGPHEKGHAEVAVSKPKGGGVATPTSEPGFSMTDGVWDSESESESEDFVFKHQRRLSDPSSNLNSFTKTGWKSFKGNSSESKRTRSQNEGLDYCSTIPEIQAGDVRDERCCSVAWSCSCVKSCPFTSSPSCCGLFTPSSPSSSPSQMEMETMNEYKKHPPHKTLSVNSGEKLRKLSQERSSSVACLSEAKLILREKLLKNCPNKLTSTGVRVFYFNDCEINKTELDDGAYNPLWTMRGFTQTLYIWRESRRAQSVPLNAFLTYITLPYSEIIKDIMEKRDEPVLTF